MEPPATGLCFHPDQYVYGIWLVPCNPAKALEDQSDWLCCLWRELDQPYWYVRYRFRLVNDPDSWSGRDTRSWTTFTRPTSEPVEAVAGDVHQIAQVVSLRLKMPVHFHRISGDGEKAMAILAQQPWVLMKEVE